MIFDLPLGPALRRFRRLNGIKQSHAAEMFGVSQGTISRWESGAHEPDEGVRSKAIDLIAARANNDADMALKRLIEYSPLPVHLVCDATHRLLAASRPRSANWRMDVAQLLGRSLWRFASPEIVLAQQSLESSGWFERPGQRLRFATGVNSDPNIAITASVMEWETIGLADGGVGRLTTTLLPGRISYS